MIVVTQLVGRCPRVCSEAAVRGSTLSEPLWCLVAVERSESQFSSVMEDSRGSETGTRAWGFAARASIDRVLKFEDVGL